MACVGVQGAAAALTALARPLGGPDDASLQLCNGYLLEVMGLCVRALRDARGERVEDTARAGGGGASVVQRRCKVGDAIADLNGTYPLTTTQRLTTCGALICK